MTAPSAVTSLKAKLTSYADQAYVDRLEGHIATDLWARKTAEWDAEREGSAPTKCTLGSPRMNRGGYSTSSYRTAA